MAQTAGANGDFLGQGWSYPVVPDQNGSLRLVGGDLKIRQSLWIILSTAPGERPMRPEFGCGIHDLVFMPNTAALRGMVQQRVQDALVRWEPRISLLGVQVDTPADARNYLSIRIDYSIRTNNAVFNLVFPFFLNEGTA
jgi:phage baseplate assembly protein W